MSQVVTPPDKIKKDIVYLLVNITPTDLEMVTRYLRIANKNYTIHLYYDGMSDLDWSKAVGGLAEIILINRNATAPETVDALLDHTAKIRWFGLGQEHSTVTDFLLKNG